MEISVRVRPGVRLLVSLPTGYDEHTRLTTNGDRVIVAHPDMPPMIVYKDAVMVPIEPADPL
jgi:hypothetical protein